MLNEDAFVFPVILKVCALPSLFQHPAIRVHVQLEHVHDPWVSLGPLDELLQGDVTVIVHIHSLQYSFTHFIHRQLHTLLLSLGCLL